MDQKEFERWMLMLIGAGSGLAIIEFLFISLVVGKGRIVGFQNGLLAGGAVVVTTVILVWFAMFLLKPVPAAEVDVGTKETIKEGA